MNIYQPVLITEEILKKFKPTRLYIKELHGIKYFGKTTRNNLYSYTGSGVYWTSLISKYGKDNIRTLWVSDLYYDPVLLQEIAISFSCENDIVHSDQWANLIPENGLTGGYNRFTKGAIELAIATRKTRYGDGWGQARTVDAKMAAYNTCILRYGNKMGMCHSDISKQKSLQTRIKKYGSSWSAANTAESKEKAKATRNKNNQNGWYTISDESLANKKAKLSHTNSRVGAERVSRPEVLELDILAKSKGVKLGRGWKSRPTEWLNEKINSLRLAQPDILLPTSDLN